MEYTKNYNLKKPAQTEFYNIDIDNSNMDVIDEELKKKYDPNNKPKPSEVGAVPELLGNSINLKINFLLGDHQRLTNHVDPTVPNLPAVSNFMHMYTAENGVVKTCLSIPYDYSAEAYIYTAFDKTWRKIADASQFLPLVGGVLSGSSLAFSDGYGQVYCDDNTINIFSKNSRDKNAGRYLGVYNDKNAIHDAVILTDLADGGSSATYRLYGDHNKDAIPFLPKSGGTATGEIATPEYYRLTGYKQLNGVDLNTVKYTGQYGVTMNCPNHPTGTGYGMLEVLMYSSHWLIQRFTSLSEHGEISGIWYRSYYNNTSWTAWEKYAMKTTNTLADAEVI